MLHDFPHVPVHVLCAEHWSEQLSDVPHALDVKLHCVPCAQVQLVPVQLGGTPPPPGPPTVLLLPPHARAHSAKNPIDRKPISPP
jgi:hypothetical protein